MKTIIILILILSNAVLSFGQNYIPLIEENRMWNLLIVNPNGYPVNDSIYYTSSLSISGDTVIGNTRYKKLFQSNEKLITNWNFVALIREDSTKKVWLKWPVNTTEALIYDFSVNIGDSLILQNDSSAYYSVDSITVVNINGETRNKYFISHNASLWSETWIEGVGSSKGLTKSGMAQAIGGWSYLLCMSESNTLIYMNPNYITCYAVSTKIKDANKLPEINIYPNPAKDILYIKNLGNNNGIINIYNSFGELLICETAIKSEIKLNIQALNSGMYIVEFINDKEKTYSKFIKK